jgi:hypothetical protein
MNLEYADEMITGKGPRITHFQNFIAFILHPIIRSKINKNKVFSDGSNRDASIPHSS